MRKIAEYEIQTITPAAPGWRVASLGSSPKAIDAAGHHGPMLFDGIYEETVAMWALVKYAVGGKYRQEIIGVTAGGHYEGLSFAEYPWIDRESGFVKYLPPGEKLSDVDLEAELEIVNSCVIERWEESKARVDAA